MTYYLMVKKPLDAVNELMNRDNTSEHVDYCGSKEIWMISKKYKINL